MNTEDRGIQVYELACYEDIVSFVVFLLREPDCDVKVGSEISLESDSEIILFDLLMRIYTNNKESKLMICCIPYYDDRHFRSSYSLYYFGKHFRYPNWCSRIFIFDGSKLEDLINNTVDKYKALSDSKKYEMAFIGSFVKRPIQGMDIGRTLIDPKYLYGIDAPYMIRTAYYSETMSGLRMHIYSFPYSMQDGETTTCAETTILNISDYFSQRYQAYRIVYPDEISSIIHENSFDRNIPSKGLSYQKISKVFMEIGFYPRLYASKFERERMLSILYCYVSSGVPVAMGIDQEFKSEVGHSVIVVGTSKCFFRNSAGECLTIDDLYIERIPNRKAQSTTFVSVLGNTDREYIIMDDGRAPYTVGKVSRQTIWELGLDRDTQKIQLIYGKNPYDWNDSTYHRPYSVDDEIEYNENLTYDISFLTVPLSKEMAMEADDAIRCFKNLLGGGKRNNNTDYIGYIKNVLMDQDPKETDQISVIAGDREDNPLILRVFLCAARSLKRFRYETMCGQGMDKWRDIYRSIHMPHFVWVCELYTLSSISRNNGARCIGEIVLDATTANSHNDDLSNVVAINYPGKIAYRSPLDSEQTLLEMMQKDEGIGRDDKDNQWTLLVPFEFEDERLKKEDDIT